VTRQRENDEVWGLYSPIPRSPHRVVLSWSSSPATTPIGGTVRTRSVDLAEDVQQGEQYAWTRLVVMETRDGRIASMCEFELDDEEAAFAFAEQRARAATSDSRSIGM